MISSFVIKNKKKLLLNDKLKNKYKLIYLKLKIYIIIK